MGHPNEKVSVSLCISASWHNNGEHSQTCIPLAFLWARNKTVFYHQFMTARKFSWPHMASLRLLNSWILSRLIDSHISFIWSKTTASLCSTLLSVHSIAGWIKIWVKPKTERPLIIRICWLSLIYALWQYDACHMIKWWSPWYHLTKSKCRHKWSVC